MLMKNNFQSKAVPRGTRTIWRYLSALFLLFTFAIGNVWAADETINLYYGTSKAVDGDNLNTEDFFFSGHTSNTGKSAVEIGGTSFTHYLTMSGYGASAINSDPAKLILYYPKKSTTTFTVYVQNKYNGNKKYYIDHLFEGETVVSDRKYQKQLAKNGTEKHEYTFTNTDKKNAVIALMPSQTMYIYQITVTESGDDLKQAGDNGYSFNTYRAGVLAEAEVNVDGLSIKPSSKLNVGASYFKIKQSSTYAKFTLSQKTLVTVGVNNSRKFIFCAAATPTDAEKADKKGTGSAGNVQTALAAGTWYLESESTSELQISNISFSIPTISYDPNGGEGSMSSNTWIVAANGFTAPSGKKFDGWKDGDDNVYTVGQEVLEDVTLYAQWKDDVAEYTVTYKDGTTELKSVNVAVGSAPDAYSPTKEFYTFAAWQKNAADYDPADLASDAAANDEITLTARWTAQYTSGTYEFTGNLTMGTDPQMTIANSSDGNNYEAGRIDNIYVSAQKIGYEATGDYGGWKLKTTNGTLRFLVENTCGIRVTIGEANPLRINYKEGGTAKSADIAKSTTSAIYKADANSLITLTNFTANNKTVTLKKIEILPLYNVTYTDETGDASGVASNVAEVTLPTPTETTVGTSTFTGWTASKVVYDGETEKAVGAALEAGKTYKLTDNTEFTAQWALIADFDVKFFQGYGDPDVQIGATQVISTGEYATAPTDPSREGYNFKGWSYDATEEHIVDVASYAITAATNFTAIWKQVFAVTFDGAGSVNVESGSKVASPDSPSQAGKVFQGWYNGESKYDFSAAVTGNLALTSKWATADANHFVYAYNDDFHFDGVVYKTPDGKTKDPEAAEASNVALATNPYTLFSGAAGITSIVATNGIYDYKKANNTKHITAYLKLKADDATSNVVFTIASGYTAVLKLKMNGYSSDATISLKKGDDAVTPSGTQGGTAEGKNYGELTYSLTAGEYKLTTANKTLYISHIDLEATVIPPHVVTYLPGEGSGPEFVIDDDATVVADCPAEFTAPAGKIFHGWKDALDNDVAVGAIVEADMTLTAQWIAHYAVTFDMQGHGTQIVAQDIVHGSKAVKPADPIAIGWDFGGWFTDAECTAGNEFDFNTPITVATPLFAKWTAFDGCAVLVPATSGSTLNAGDAVDLQTGSTGGSIKALTDNLSYDANGLLFGDNSSTKVEVTLTHLMKEGTVITATIYNADASKARGLNLLNSNGTSKATWTKTQAGDHVETYTVVADDGLDGSNVFQLQRNQNAYLKELKVSNCGTELIFHNLTSVVDPAGKGTVTLDANSVPEGHTTKATYSAIDPAYEFVSWSVSGAGASIDNATANPVTVTMGTEDAVITLNLQVKPVYYTVTYMDGTTEMGTEEVAENGHPTAAGIATAKKGSTFLGWSEIDGGAVVDLADITITAAKTIYAKYEAIACPVSGTVFSMTVTDPEDTEYNENNEFGLEIGATYTGGKAYSGSKSSTKRIGKIDENGEYSFNSNGDVTVKIDLDCALQEGDVITFTSTPSRELKIQKVAGTDLYTTSSKTFTIPAASSLIGEYEIYLMRGNSESTFKTFNVYRPAVLTGVTLADAVVAIDGKVTPVMTLAPAPDAYISSQVWSIEGAGEGTIATINTETGEVTGKAIGSVTVKVVLNGSIENTCTVTVIDSYTQVAVTETSEWNFAGAAAASSKINFPNSTEEFLLANISGVNNTPEFNSRALVVKGKYVSNSQLQAQTIRFNVTTSGKLTIRYACTSNKGEGNNRELYINGVATGSMTYNDEVTYSQVVPGGEVTIKALYDKESVLTEDIMNYKYIKFDVTPDVSDADYTRDVTEGRYGTICLPNGGVMVGAEIFTLAYYGATSQKFFFDEIASAEMEAGKPYLFFPHEGATQLGVYYTDAAGEAAKTVNGFVGFIGADADDYTQVPANDNCYIISNNLYRQVQTGAVAYILSNRAYIDMTSVTNIEPAKAPGARRIGLGVQGKDQAQGFENIETGDAPMKVMINGTMYILRGEKVYDATGRLVK